MSTTREPPVSTRQERWLRLAAIFALVGLALMVWSIFDPRPIPIIASMSVGQAIGTLSFALYLAVVIDDLRKRIAAGRRAARELSAAAAPSGSPDRDDRGDDDAGDLSDAGDSSDAGDLSDGDVP